MSTTTSHPHSTNSSTSKKQKLLHYLTYLASISKISEHYIAIIKEILGDTNKLIDLYHVIDVFYVANVESEREDIIERKNEKENSIESTAVSINQSELEQYSQAIYECITKELKNRWRYLKLLDSYPVEYVKELSNVERNQFNEAEKLKATEQSNDSLIYGEVDAYSFADIFVNYLHLPNGGIFVDLGSGTGRAVFSAALYHNFDQLIGIEILPVLYNISMKVYNDNSDPNKKAVKKEISKKPAGTMKNGKFIAESKDDLPCASFSNTIKWETIKFVLDDIRNYDWSNADVVFCAATCFSGALLAHVAEKAELVKEGTYIISLSETLNVPYLKLAHTVVYKMSWGRATVHIHQKIKL